jgi:hypothetical protein
VMLSGDGPVMPVAVARRLDTPAARAGDFLIGYHREGL